ncbi:MAG: efflux transporter periplasmic adaptor subunit, partial [Proteobacteria bacterium]
VTRTAGAFDPATRTMLVELRVPNPKGDLYTGMYAQAHFHLQSTQPPIVVSGNALIVGGEGPRIAVVDSSETVHIHKVHLGRDYGKDVEIIEGLQEGERVIVNPRDTLIDGIKVKAVVLETAPKAESEKSGAPATEKKKL